MSVFSVYLKLGFEHLLDLAAADHILFVAVLCAPYAVRHWKSLLVLVTAFTVGHSVSLALATVGWVRMDSGWVEFLIPVTIAAAAAANLGWSRRGSGRAGQVDGAKGGADVGGHSLKYLLALGFGLIHGLGFSNFLRLMLGSEGSLFLPLLGFNVGLELAQIVVVALVLGMGHLLGRFTPVTQRGWNWAISWTVGAVAVVMALQRLPW